MANVPKKAKAAIPYSELPYSGQPSDTETWTIGGDVYEACTAAGSVAADSRIAVLIGSDADATYANLVAAINADNKTDQHPTLFRTDDTTPARANGREKFRAVQDTANNIVYLYRAKRPGGVDLEEGSAPSVALSDTVSNGGPWKHLNANLSVAGAGALMDKSADLVHAVTAANISAGSVKIPLPFTPRSFIAQVRTSAGVPIWAADLTVTVPTAVAGQAFLGLTLNPGTSNAVSLTAGDVIYLHVAG